MSNELQQRIDKIKKSPTDTKLYRGLVLKNGLTVLLINDCDAAVSSVSLTLSVGSLSDPEDVPGLANLCKRMLPLGSKKYPGEFKDFVFDHNGYYSSYVETDHTNFYSVIDHGFIFPLLDRFARSFYEPLFPKDKIEREINIIDDEHKINVAADISHVTQLKRNLIDENHPLNHFGNGSKTTLMKIPKSNGVIIYDYLLAFYFKWYSAHLMYLAVYSKEDLDFLEKLVQSIFGKIEKKYVNMPTWSDKIYKENILSTKTIMVTKSMKLLNLSFPICCQTEYYKTMPTKYVQSIIEYQNSTSIIHILRNKGLARNLTASHKCVARNINFFEIDVDLTERGVDNVNDVIALIIQCIQMIKMKGVQKRFHEEIVNTSQMEFQLPNQLSPLKYVSTLTPKMIKYKLKNILIAENVITKWNPVLVEKLLSYLRPISIRIIVASNVFKNNTAIIDKYYGTQYLTTEVQLKELMDWQLNDICKEYEMPPDNKFTAKDFTLVPIDIPTDSENPRIIYESIFIKCWYKKDTTFRTPKIFISVKFLSPIIKKKQLYSVILTIFVRLFNDAFSKHTYYTTKAGFKLSIIPCNNGLKIQLNGFNDKAPILLTTIVDELFTFNIEPIRFNIIKEEIICQLKKNKLPYQKAIELNSFILSEAEWNTDELDIIYDIKIDDVEHFRRKFFSEIHIETFIYGNILINRAIELNHTVESTLFNHTNYTNLTAGKMCTPKEVKLCQGENILFKITNNTGKSSSVFINFQCGIQSMHNIVIINLFNKLIEMSCIRVLKNREKLGYIVKSLTRLNNGILYWGIVIESDTTDLKHIHTRIEKFIDSIEILLKDLDQNTFEEYKMYFLGQLMQDPGNFDEQALMYDSEIAKRDYIFNKSTYLADALIVTSKDDIIQFYRDFISKFGKKRGVLAVHVISNNDQSNSRSDNSSNDNWTMLTDIAKFKKKHRLYPISPLPLFNIFTDM